MIWFTLYIIFGLFHTYITGGLYLSNKSKFTTSDMIVWFSFWPCLVLSTLAFWVVEGRK